MGGEWQEKRRRKEEMRCDDSASENNLLASNVKKRDNPLPEDRSAKPSETCTYTVS